MRHPKRMRVSAVLNDLEDPKVFEYLADLTGEGRAMRLRLLIRSGFDALHPSDRHAVGTISAPALPAPTPPPPTRPSKTLVALGVNGFKEFPSTITKGAHRHDHT